MRRALAAAAVAALVLTGCSGTDEPTSAESPTTGTTTGSGSPTGAASPSESPTASPTESSDSDDSEAIEIEIEGDRVEPNGKRVKVTAGETVTFDVESDRAAELHVHSSPEQVLEVEPGESTLTLVIDRPGVVDIEEHESGRILVQLEVR
ncbi:MAG TPA: hypothetical protein VFZ64_16525 [Nocardioidaceae bacterium]